MVIAHEIGKSFDNKRVLNNISFHIKRGEILVILGDSVIIGLNQGNPVNQGFALI